MVAGYGLDMTSSLRFGLAGFGFGAPAKIAARMPSAMPTSFLVVMAAQALAVYVSVLRSFISVGPVRLANATAAQFVAPLS